MAYKKPEIVAKSSVQKSYVAGCPAKDNSSPWKVVNGVRISFKCAKCEISGR